MKYRARARAITRRREPQPWLPWLLLLLLSLGVALFGAIQAAPANPQVEGGPTKPKIPLQKQPPAAGVIKAAPGVLKPKTNSDPGMLLATPNPKKFPMPVLRPNEAHGNTAGSAKIVPK